MSDLPLKAERAAHRIASIFLDVNDEYNEAERFFTACSLALLELDMFPTGQGHRAFMGAWSMWIGWSGGEHADAQPMSRAVGKRARAIHDEIIVARGAP